MSVHSFDGYGQLCDWCIEHGYDVDNEIDAEEDNHKRSTFRSFYLKHNASDTYAEISVETDYINGWGFGEVQRVGLKRIEKEVVVKQVSYE